MKLHFVSFVLLLVPIWAELSSPKPLPSLDLPTSRTLYDEDHLISEAFDARILRYNYNSQQLIFFTQNNNTKQLTEFLILKGNFKNESHSFAVENFDYAPNEESDEEFCVNSSAEQFRGMIYLCRGKILIRDLTEEERNRTEEFKNEQQGVDMSFKVIFDKRSIRTQSLGLDELSVADLPQSNGQDKFSVDALVTFAYDRTSKDRYMKLLSNLTERSFVVEGLTEHDTVDCYRTEPADLKPIECNGQIQLRPLADDD